MNSTDVNKAIRQKIKPNLAKMGFSFSNNRTFWRHTGKDIHVINFQSFNAYNSSVLDVTTFSYTINIGLFSNEINLGHAIKIKNELLLPEEYNCHFRGKIKPSLKFGIKSDSIWRVKEDGGNLDECINDSLVQIDEKIEKWFGMLDTKEKKIQLVEGSQQQNEILWGWGNNPSPIRSLILSCLYYSIDTGIAKKYIDEVISSGCYRELFETNEEGMEFLKRTESNK